METIGSVAALIIQIGFPFKGFIKGYYKESIRGVYDMGAFNFSIWFWGPIIL